MRQLPRHSYGVTSQEENSYIKIPCSDISNLCRNGGWEGGGGRAGDGIDGKW